MDNALIMELAVHRTCTYSRTHIPLGEIVKSIKWPTGCSLPFFDSPKTLPFQLSLGALIQSPSSRKCVMFPGEMFASTGACCFAEPGNRNNNGIFHSVTTRGGGWKGLSFSQCVVWACRAYHDVKQSDLITNNDTNYTIAYNFTVYQLFFLELRKNFLLGLFFIVLVFLADICYVVFFFLQFAL